MSGAPRTFGSTLRSRIALLLLNILSAGAYSGQVEPSSALESSPSDVKLTIRTHGMRSVFQIGEMIELELSFTSTARRKYLIAESTDSRPYTPDRIAVTPLSGWLDPLGNFYPLCQTIYSESILSSTHMLSTEPFVFRLELNKWVRFDDPGEYRITIQSQRVGTANPKRLLTLNSNRLPLRIVPATTQWQEETLRNAMTVLDQTASATNLTWEQQRTRWQATSILRYLGTPDAARAMAQRLKSNDLAHDLLLGLVESPARETVLEQMRVLLVEPDFPVTDWFLCATAYVARPRDATIASKDQLEPLESRFRDQLRAVLQNKRGQALTVSTKTANGGR